VSTRITAPCPARAITCDHPDFRAMDLESVRGNGPARG
jgi:hypothetical protein